MTEEDHIVRLKLHILPAEEGLRIITVLLSLPLDHDLSRIHAAIVLSGYYRLRQRQIGGPSDDRISDLADQAHRRALDLRLAGHLRGLLLPGKKGRSGARVGVIF